ncbi:aminoacyl-tRNA hydrolase [Chromatiales bacterium (ex Bugula neritina AB1)]|nr:aminoacyl-tRNA hydrolase [Chromatiales bacterium (ex Bugula neritina AB1)]
MTNGERRKQVILVRKDLKMRRGKEIAQGSHASMEFLVSSLRNSDQPQITELDADTIRWINKGMPKICLRVNSEAQLLELHEAAREQGLKSQLIKDSGRTEFGGVPTYTACAIGPNLACLIDRITGELTPY